MTEVANAYTRRAAEYAEAIGAMDVVHPADRHVVDTWAPTVSGRVIDAGYGPGHWTNHLAGLGLDVRGIDLVPAFVAHARASYPGVRFDLESIDDIRERLNAAGRRGRARRRTAQPVRRPGAPAPRGAHS